MTLNGEYAKGQFKPVYKSECRFPKAPNKWNTVFTNTDTLANSDPSK